MRASGACEMRCVTDAEQETIGRLEARYDLPPRLCADRVDEAVALLVEFFRSGLDVVDLELDGGLGNWVRRRPHLDAEARVGSLRQGPHPEMLGPLERLRVTVVSIRDAAGWPKWKSHGLDEKVGVLARRGADDGKPSDEANVHGLSVSHCRHRSISWTDSIPADTVTCWDCLFAQFEYETSPVSPEPSAGQLATVRTLPGRDLDLRG